MTTKFAVDLSGGARETMRCLFFHGPTGDGDIPSKMGRGELCGAGYAEHQSGFAFLTSAGLEAAIGLGLDREKEKWQRWRGAWQLIETAPKDGTGIILAKIAPTRGAPDFGIEAHEPFVWWATKGFWSDRWNNWNDGVEPTGLAEPTHWIGIPGLWK